jgi:hypothetical protein
MAAAASAAAAAASAAAAPKPAPGEFQSLGYSKSMTEGLKDFYDTITRLNMWDVMAKEVGKGGYMFSRDPNMNTIIKSTSGLNDYSGSSIGGYMREMQYIAQHGWDAWLES